MMIREAKEGDCGNILRLIRVRAAGWKPGSKEGRQSGWGGGVEEEEVGAEGGARPEVLLEGAARPSCLHLASVPAL